MEPIWLTRINLNLSMDHGLTWISALITYHMPGKVWDEITCPFAKGAQEQYTSQRLFHMIKMLQYHQYTV